MDWGRVASRRQRERGRTNQHWARLSRAELLDLRFCDLDLRIEGTWLEECVDQARRELAARRLSFRPHFWLSHGWFCPDGVPGVAIPFYLAHPRLMQLERSQIHEVEGASRQECMKLLRHEIGHAIDNAYRLSHRRRWQHVFGKASTPYPDYYSPDPTSKRFVHHLPDWYAQSHPSEDFAETFAVWLTPRLDFRKVYAEWPALRKLEYIDQLMAELSGKKPLVSRRSRPHSMGSMKKTLREHYREKRAHYMVGQATSYDEDLKSLFAGAEGTRGAESAASFLRGHRTEIRRMALRWVGDHAFTLDRVLQDMTSRCSQLRLRASGRKHQLKVDFAMLLTVRTMQQLYVDRYWIPV